MPDKNCSTCIYYVPDNGAGRCHVRPPTIVVKQETGNVHQSISETDYPVIVEPMSIHSWCGDHRFAPPEVA